MEYFTVYFKSGFEETEHYTFEADGPMEAIDKWYELDTPYTEGKICVRSYDGACFAIPVVGVD